MRRGCIDLLRTKTYRVAIANNLRKNDFKE